MVEMLLSDYKTTLSDEDFETPPPPTHTRESLKRAGAHGGVRWVGLDSIQNSILVVGSEMLDVFVFDRIEIAIAQRFFLECWELERMQLN